MDNMLTRQQAAERMGISLDVLDRLRSSGDLAYVQHHKGSKVWVPEWAIEQYFARITRPARPAQKEPVMRTDLRSTGLMWAVFIESHSCTRKFDITQ